MIIRTLLIWTTIVGALGLVVKAMSGDVMTGYDVFEFFRELIDDIWNIQNRDVVWVLGRLVIIWVVGFLAYGTLQALLQRPVNIIKGKWYQWKYWQRRRWEDREAKRRRPLIEAEQRRREEEQVERARLAAIEAAEKEALETAAEEAQKQAALEQLGKLGRME